jgi:hypothetical protein
MNGRQTQSHDEMSHCEVSLAETIAIRSVAVLSKVRRDQIDATIKHLTLIRLTLPDLPWSP